MSTVEIELHAELSKHLARIQKIFKPGAKLTLLIRHPSIPDGESDVVMSNDDNYEDLIAAIQRRWTKP